MKQSDRLRLTAALREHVAAIAGDLRVQMRGSSRAAAVQLHKDEAVGDDFDVWTDLLSRRAAVLWVLKSVYVRVLEDRGLLAPGRLLDPEAQQLFEKLAPNLGETAFLRWVYRDLASPDGGLPELFSVQPAELALPSDERSRALISFWRHRDADSGAHWSFVEEHFEGELMGDLYQELDPVVKDRFALCQTPDFVRAFILDRTLTPAIETFGADKVRLLDPACGSGHFLIDGLKRLVAATGTQHSDWTREKVLEHTLRRVVGMDLNDYACALARARLVMTAAELAGVNTLAEAANFHPHVYWADGLEQFERDEVKPSLQFGLFEKVEEKPRAMLTRTDVRAELRKVFAEKFQAVVANPPYITEHDIRSKRYHQENKGKTRRYISAHGEYSLASPFTERCFQLADNDGYIGVITSNNFMKRNFGKPLIEKLFGRIDLTLVVDTSQAFIPFHGTPTVLLFGRNRRPIGDTVRTVMGKRGEAGIPVDPEKGRVWTSIIEGWNKPGYENEFISVTDLPRKVLDNHPWSLGGGGAAELKQAIEDHGCNTLGQICIDVGRTTVCGEDSAFIVPKDAANRVGGGSLVKPFVAGEAVRDWAIHGDTFAIYPYQALGGEPIASNHPCIIRHFWYFRTLLRNRSIFGKTLEERGDAWYGHLEHYSKRLANPLSITFAYVATHNHFTFDRGGKLFNRSAPAIKLTNRSSEDEHLYLIGLLNSSTACFWMKQVFHNKGLRGQGGGITATDWEQFFDFDSTKIKLFPIPPQSERTLIYARLLDALAHTRSARTIQGLLDDSNSWTKASDLRGALDTRAKRDNADLLKMVALQEELDWLCYELYGLDDSEGKPVPVEQVDPILPTWLPWVLNLAVRDAQIQILANSGEDPEELPSVWFERHGWTPVTVLPDEVPKVLRARIEARRKKIASSPALTLIESPNFKRRWYQPDYIEEERQALELWLAERIEAIARERAGPFTLEQLVALLQDDPRTLAVCEILTGRLDFSLLSLVADALSDDTVPNHSLHIYKPSGLFKRGAWERMWEAQRREDAGEDAEPEVPPSYVTGDFLKSEYWQLRGKLDVPKERFIAFTEVPGRTGADTLYGWAGWTPLQRLKALLAIDEDLEDAGTPLADRTGVLDSAWRLLPDVAREDPQAAARLKAELQALVGPTGPSPEALEDWRKRFPPPKPPKKKTERPRKAPRAAEEDDTP